MLLHTHMYNLEYDVDIERTDLSRRNTIKHHFGGWILAADFLGLSLDFS